LNFQRVGRVIVRGSPMTNGVPESSWRQAAQAYSFRGAQPNAMKKISRSLISRSPLPKQTQTRMCRFPASGSSWESLARGGVPIHMAVDYLTSLPCQSLFCRSDPTHDFWMVLTPRSPICRDGHSRTTRRTSATEPLSVCSIARPNSCNSSSSRLTFLS